MPDLTPFELRLTELLEDDSRAGIRPIDRYAIARSAIAGGRRRGAAGLPSLPRWARPVVIVMLLVALTGAAIGVGTRLLDQVTPAPLELTITPTGPMAHERSHHAATRLLDGRVLITGGHNGRPGPGVTTEGLRRTNMTAELYDPATRAFAPTGDPIVPRLRHTSTLLDDGRVLLIGDGSSNPGAELYDPTTGRFTPASGFFGRSRSAALRLSDGRVAIIGGEDRSPLDGIDIYDPATDTSVAGPTDPLLARVDPHAALLADGRVLIAGGAGGPESDGYVYEHAAIWDPATDAVIDVGALPGPTFPKPESSLRGIRRNPTYQPDVDHVGGMTVLRDGRVLFVLLDDRSQWSVHTFDPLTLTFTHLADRPGRPIMDLAVLGDGRIFFTRLDAGGCCGVEAAVLDPTTGQTTSIGEIPGLGTGNGIPDATVTALDDGSVLIAGGNSGGGDTLADAWIVGGDEVMP